MIAKMIRLLSGKRFSHISISDDDVLTSMYSFCRDRRTLPLPAHFNEERIEMGIFGMHGIIACEIYRIPITEAQHREYKRMISHFVLNRKRYGYNVVGLIAILFHIRYEITRSFVCSVWVGFMLHAIGIIPNKDKDVSLYEPEDFRRIPGASLIYEGNLKSYPHRRPPRTR